MTLLDLTVLIAATAIGLAAARGAGWMPRTYPPRGWSHHAVQAVAALRVPWYLLVAWGPALLALGALPASGRRGRAWQPGMAACAALTAALIVDAIPYLIFAPSIGIRRAMDKGFLPGVEGRIEDHCAHAAFAVAGTWAALFVAGRWRPGRGWLDRAGWLLGLAWVGGYAIDRAALILIAVVE